MSKSKRKKEAIRRAKRKRAIITVIASIAVITIIIITIIIFSVGNRDVTELTEELTELTELTERIYDRGSAMVTLSDNGSFAALLWHGDTRSGTFTESVVNGDTSITFMYNGSTGVGRIDGNVLHIPEQWDDLHRHGTEFFLR